MPVSCNIRSLNKNDSNIKLIKDFAFRWLKIPFHIWYMVFIDINTPVEELGTNNPNNNNPRMYHVTGDSHETIVKSHDQFITSAGLEMSEEDQNLPYLHWTPKLPKSPYKHHL